MLNDMLLVCCFTAALPDPHPLDGPRTPASIGKCLPDTAVTYLDDSHYGLRYPNCARECAIANYYIIIVNYIDIYNSLITSPTFAVYKRKLGVTVKHKFMQLWFYIAATNMQTCTCMRRTEHGAISTSTVLRGSACSASTESFHFTRTYMSLFSTNMIILPSFVKTRAVHSNTMAPVTGYGKNRQFRNSSETSLRFVSYMCSLCFKTIRLC